MLLCLPTAAGILLWSGQNGHYSLALANLGFIEIIGTICRFGAVSGRRAACNADNRLEDTFRFSFKED